MALQRACMNKIMLSCVLAVVGGTAFATTPAPSPLPPGARPLPKPGQIPAPYVDPMKKVKLPFGDKPKMPTYQGHGATTVDAATLEKFRAPPVAAQLSRRVQSLLDVRAPGAGIPTDDGKGLIFNWSVTGIPQVWMLDGAKRFPKQLTGGEDTTSVAAVLADDKTLVLVRDQKGEENPGIYLQARDGGALRVVQHLPQVQTQLQYVSHDGRYLYFRTNKDKPDAYSLVRYDVSTQQSTAIWTEPGLWNIADRRGDDKAGALGVLLVGKEVGSNMTEYFELDESAGKMTPLFGQDEREDYDAAYGAKDTVLVLTPKLTEFRALYRFDRSSKQLQPMIAIDNADIEGFSVDHARTRMLVAVNDKGYTRARAYDAKTAKPLTLPPMPTAEHVRWGATSHNGRYTAVSIDTGVAPAESFVLDWQQKKLTAWHQPSVPEIDLKNVVATTLESYPARDGANIPMFVRRPQRCAQATNPCPVIVDFHGGPEAQARPGFNLRAQLFVDSGFIFVQPNVRGSDGYGKTWLHADDGKKRQQVVTDIEDAAIYIKKAWQKNGTAPKVGITGGSYGGYSTLMGMTAFAGAYDCGVEVVGISNLVTFLENTAPYRRALRISEYGDPVADRDALLQLSPITHVKKARAPLLLIQGATDPRVPVGEAVQMYEALQQNKVKSQLIVFADEGHGVQRRENQVLALGHTLGFFLTHLAGQPVP
jgi:dipeptidyl aminopeptidase/acylaminoacyl peptidase